MKSIVCVLCVIAMAVVGIACCTDNVKACDSYSQQVQFSTAVAYVQPVVAFQQVEIQPVYQQQFQQVRQVQAVQYQQVQQQNVAFFTAANYSAPQLAVVGCSRANNFGCNQQIRGNRFGGRRNVEVNVQRSRFRGRG